MLQGGSGQFLGSSPIAEGPAVATCPRLPSEAPCPLCHRCTSLEPPQDEEMPSAARVASHVPPVVGQVSGHGQHVQNPEPGPAGLGFVTCAVPGWLCSAPHCQPHSGPGCALNPPCTTRISHRKPTESSHCSAFCSCTFSSFSLFKCSFETQTSCSLKWTIRPPQQLQPKSFSSWQEDQNYKTISLRQIMHSSSSFETKYDLQFNFP